MESITSSVSATQPSHHDELFMQQRVAFSESLNELKSLRKQLHSAAEYFELTYRKEDRKRIVAENLKEYTLKAFINTLDHLGSTADKINSFVDEQNVQVSRTDLALRCFEHRLRTCQDFTDRCGLLQQSLVLSLTKQQKRYIIPVGSIVPVVDHSGMVYHNVDDDLFQFNGTSKENSPTIVSDECSSASTQSPKSSPKTFQFTRFVPKTEIERQEPSPRRLPVMLRSGSLMRSTTMNSYALKKKNPPEHWRSVSMSLNSDRERAKSPEQPPGSNNRLLKALVSMRKYRKEI